MGSSTAQGEILGRGRYRLGGTSRTGRKASLEGDAVGCGMWGRKTRFFDAGCGAGGASALAAQYAVHGSPASMHRKLSSPSHASGCRMASFVVGDLENLPYDDDSFDVTFAANSVMFATDPARAVRELARVTAPGGRVAVGIWGTPEECEMRHIFKALVDTLPTPPRGEGPFALSGHGVLEGLFTQAALKVLTSGETDCSFEYADFESAWRAISSAGPYQAAMQSVTETEIKIAVQAALKPYQDSQGRVRLENRFRYVIGTR